MPRITPPSAEAIAARRREYAIFAQCGPDAEGNISEKAFDDLATPYLVKEKLPNADGITFEQFADALKAPEGPFKELADAEGNCVGYAARDASGNLAPFKFTRRAVGPLDVHIQIVAAGICHSDLHQIKNEWGGSTFPMVPGHEIAGIVTEVGSEVTKFKVGDKAGVGCMVMSCQLCKQCKCANEQYCNKGVFTYNSKDYEGNATHGGYSSHVVVDERFVLRIPDNLPLDAAAPLLCAGITAYSPIMHYKMAQPGSKVGVVGLGGLGHMGVKLFKAMGCEVTVISTSPGKKAEALDVLGADHFIVSKDEEQMKAAMGSLDAILDTVSAAHDISSLLNLLVRPDGKLIFIGAPPEPAQLPIMTLLFNRLTVGGSLIGGIKETQEMLDFCGKHNITCCIEKIPIDYVNTAMERLVKSDVRYRFVIDIAGSLAA